MVRRCWVILLAAEGVANRRIGPEVGLSENQVGVWRQRFETERLAGLKDRRRSGQPRVYGHDERLKIVATATSRRPQSDSHWSHRCWQSLCPSWAYPFRR
jgi:transposase